MNNNLLETDKAWLAGFVDGEGYIGIVRQRKKPNEQQSASWQYHPWLIVANTNKPAIERIRQLLNVGRIAEQKHTSSDKDSYYFKVNKLVEVKDIIDAISPYLKIKFAQARLLQSYCNLRSKVVIVTGRGSRGATTFGDQEENIYLELRRLNQKGKLWN